MAQLGHCLAFDLANSLPGETELLADLIPHLGSLDQMVRGRAKAAVDAIQEIERIQSEAASTPR